MQLVEQGDLLKVDGLSHPVIVVSNNFLISPAGPSSARSFTALRRARCIFD